MGCGSSLSVPRRVYVDRPEIVLGRDRRTGRHSVGRRWVAVRTGAPSTRRSRCTSHPKSVRRARFAGTWAVGAGIRTHPRRARGRSSPRRPCAGRPARRRRGRPRTPGRRPRPRPRTGGPVRPGRPEKRVLVDASRRSDDPGESVGTYATRRTSGRSPASARRSRVRSACRSATRRSARNSAAFEWISTRSSRPRSSRTTGESDQGVVRSVARPPPAGGNPVRRRRGRPTARGRRGAGASPAGAIRPSAPTSRPCPRSPSVRRPRRGSRRPAGRRRTGAPRCPPYRRPPPVGARRRCRAGR